MKREFRQAPMDRLLLGLTLLVLALPVGLAAFSLSSGRSVLLAAGLLTALVAPVWLWMRPRRLVVDEHALTIAFPLRAIVVPRTAIAAARVLDRVGLRSELGRAMRVGVGGLFGGFGLLRTQKRGWMRFYITRTDRLVFVDVKAGGRCYLLSAANPDALAAALSTTTPDLDVVQAPSVRATQRR
jgi:hypothetical protein